MQLPLRFPELFMFSFLVHNENCQTRPKYQVETTFFAKTKVDTTFVSPNHIDIHYSCFSL